MPCKFPHLKERGGVFIFQVASEVVSILEGALKYRERLIGNAVCLVFWSDADK